MVGEVVVTGAGAGAGAGGSVPAVPPTVLVTPPTVFVTVPTVLVVVEIGSAGSVGVDGIPNPEAVP